ncbi:hypothetical protein L5515_002861 [Caenorhabditis briggsae]|uniref:C-type lectin domain-containing protein n=1 Tax=Caenorhabditis briggsae TaxID=6238 RepID=A0AAE9E8S5_CAEBR|nr:hypothetical protein L5515_002861 [Caenorhabditis briggsae]
MNQEIKNYEYIQCPKMQKTGVSKSLEFVLSAKKNKAENYQLGLLATIENLPIWIGLQCEGNQNGDCFWVKNNETLGVYSNFGTDNPNWFNGSCIFYDNKGEWISKACDEKLPYVFSGLFVPGQLISIVVQSETEPTLEWLGNLGHAETFVIPSESPLTMIRKGRGRIIVDAVTNEHVLDPNGVSISPKLSIIFRTSSSVSEMIVLNGKKMLIAERRLKNADEIVLWKSDVKLLSCYHVTFFNEETELEVVDITKVEEREALLTLHRLSARNHQETAEQEQMADTPTVQLSQETSHHEETITSITPFDEEKLSDDSIDQSAQEISHSSKTDDMSDEKMSGVSISPIDPDESIQLTLPNEQEGSRSSITEEIAEEMLPVDPIGTVAQGESVPSFPPTSFSDTIAQLRLYFNQELSNEGAMPAVSADRAIHSAKRTSSVPIRQYLTDTVDENELAVKKPRFFSPQRQVLKPLNTSSKLAMSPEAPSSEHPTSLVEPLVVLQKSPEEPWAELLNRPKTQTLPEALQQLRPLKRYGKEVTLKEYLQIQFKGQLLRTIDWNRVDDLKLFHPKTALFQSTNHPILLLAGKSFNRALLVEGNHRTAALSECHAQKELSDDDLKSTVPLTFFQIPKPEFNNMWMAANELGRQVQAQARFDWKNASSRTREAVFSEFKKEAYRTKGKFSKFESSILALEFLNAEYDEQARLDMKNHPSKRTEATDRLVTLGLVDSNMGGGRTEGIPVAMFLSRQLTQEAFVESIRNDSYPSGSKIHEVIWKCSTENDSGTAELLWSVTKGEMKAAKFVANLDIILNGGTVNVKETGAAAQIAGITVVEHMNDVPNGGYLVTIDTIPKMSKILSKKLTVAVFRANNSTLCSILSEFGEADRVRKGVISKTGWNGPESTFYTCFGERVLPEPEVVENTACTKIPMVFLKSEGSKKQILNKPIFALKRHWN